MLAILQNIIGNILCSVSVADKEESELMSAENFSMLERQHAPACQPLPRTLEHIFRNMFQHCNHLKQVCEHYNSMPTDLKLNAVIFCPP